MESRIAHVRRILNELVDQSGGSPGHGRFWNLSRDEFVNGPVHGKVPIRPGDPENSFLVAILRGPADGFNRMPQPSGPYISNENLQVIIDWIRDGAPDDGRESDAPLHAPGQPRREIRTFRR